MDLARAPINPPEGITDVSEWSLACATRNHQACKGVRINPDLNAAPKDTSLPCKCTVCAGDDRHRVKRRGRPPKNAPKK
ncbi:hypothetical protein ACIHFD_49130 [Nonomuraea sp. NPDC051941]|uniref:hypothetical protein n=1 Tax=Nonomuraea sp. NPDC051941 TaxID=3364373 RepID=UPI0037CAA2B0